MGVLARGRSRVQATVAQRRWLTRSNTDGSVTDSGVEGHFATGDFTVTGHDRGNSARSQHDAE